MQKCLIRRFISAISILGLLTPGLALGAGSEARVMGRVLGPGGQDPVSGVMVRAISPDTGQTEFTAGPTDAEGLFEIERVPAGSYELAFEVQDRIWSGNTALRIDSGQTRSVLVTLAPARSDDEDPESANPDKQPPPKPAVVSKGPSRWRNPLLATLSVVTLGGIIGSQLDKDKDDPSPSNP